MAQLTGVILAISVLAFGCAAVDTGAHAAVPADPAGNDISAPTAAPSPDGSPSRKATPGKSASEKPKAAARSEEIVVTGSRLKRSGQARESPITTVGAADLRAEGTTRVEDLLNTLPQVNAGLNSGALGPTGTATVDLRGFGAFRTLVLINGRRLNPGDPFNPAADLNSIPASMVRRVDVLTGGASSIYGSDAIAGVVNFIMDTNYTGLKLDAQGTLFQYNNGNDTLLNLARGTGAGPPRGNRLDGGTADLSAVYGTDFAGDAGHVTAYLGYLRNNAVRGSSRDYSACNLREAGSFYECIRDDNTYPASFQDTAGNATTIDRATGNTLRPYVNGQDGYNTAPFQDLQRSDERFNAGFFAHYTINDAIQPYAEAQFSDDRTRADFEPSSTALNSFGVNCNNPLLSPSEAASFCTQNGLGPADTTQLVIGRRNVEGQPRVEDFEHASYRGLIGVKGQIDEPWSYDAYAQYGFTDATIKIKNDLSLTRLGRALNVVNVAGRPTCQSVVDGSDPACVPYNIFSLGGVTPSAERYISETGKQNGRISQGVVSAALTGRLGKYGMTSPFAHDGVAVVGGAEYRTQSVRNTPDLPFVSGDLTSTSPQNPIQGSYDVYEFFGELSLPLIQDKPFFRNLSLSLSDRYGVYNLQGPANAHTIGGEWEIVRGFSLRGSGSRAIRAPNGHELFVAQTLQKFQAPDPCAGINPIASFAQCARSGVTAAEYGRIQDTGNFNYLTGGNPNLRPETSHSFTFGAVWEPRFAPGFLISADYWHIKVSNYDGQYAPNSTLNNCINGGSSVYCSLVQRDGQGSLSIGSGLGAGRVVATNLNTGSFSESGIDLTSTYRVHLSPWGILDGDLSLRFNGSVALDNQIKPIRDSNAVVFDCAGLFGPTCTGEGPTSPIPTWRHTMRATWSKSDAYEVSLIWRHVSGLSSELASGQSHLAGAFSAVDQRVQAYDYLDLEADYDISPKYNVHIGATNLFGSNPPYVGSNANPQVLPGNLVASYYDPLGRSVFLGVTVRY